MSQIQSLLETMKNQGYDAKKQLLEYLLQNAERAKKGAAAFSGADRAAILDYLYAEIDPMLAAIGEAACYREKSLVTDCADMAIGLVMLLCASPEEVPQDVFGRINILSGTLTRERYLENYIDEMFTHESVTQADIQYLRSCVAEISDEYHKGMVYAGFLHYSKDIAKLSEGAKESMTAHITAEMQRYLALPQLSEDQLGNLELIADIGKEFADEAFISALYAMLQLGRSNISFYAVESLLALGREIPAQAVDALARDLEYAHLTYSMLAAAGKADLFPGAYAGEEDLAKSDLVHWLTYPTELGQAPDEIEYIGKVTYLFKKDVYHVFKYRSSSDTLGDELKGKWLIGWSSDDGGTFSNFDEYAKFEEPTVAATLKNIKKKLIG